MADADARWAGRAEKVEPKVEQKVEGTPVTEYRERRVLRAARSRPLERVKTERKR